MNIAIYIYDNAEVLDFSGPFEVFSTAQRLSQQLYKVDIFNVFLIAQSAKVITARAGYQVLPTYTFSDHPDIDVLIVVGGVHHEEMNKPAVIQWIKQQATQAKIVASVCTGAFLLAQAQVISQHQVTTHWEDIADLKAQFPSLTVLENIRWVQDGNIMSSAGISAGIDMSLQLVTLLQDQTLAIATARKMDYHWQIPNS